MLPQTPTITQSGKNASEIISDSDLSPPAADEDQSPPMTPVIERGGEDD